MGRLSGLSRTDPVTGQVIIDSVEKTFRIKPHFLARHVLPAAHMENTLPERQTERRRPPIVWALIELHQLLEARLGAERGIGDRRRQILRALLRASTALTQASAGRDATRKLSRARAAMDDCEIALLLLYERLGADFVELALSHVDRIARGIDDLAKLDVAKWPDTQLAPLPQKQDDATVERQPTWMLRQITTRIAAIVQTHTPAAAPSRSAGRRRRHFKTGNGSP
jgi:hypothetical protein